MKPSFMMRGSFSFSTSSPSTSYSSSFNNNNNNNNKKTNPINRLRNPLNQSSSLSTIAASTDTSSSSSSSNSDTCSVIRKIGNKIRSGDLTAVRVTEIYLSRMSKTTTTTTTTNDCSYDRIPTSSAETIKKDRFLNAYVSMNVEKALEAAQIIDDEFKKGNDRGILAGIPIAVKDNICTKNMSTSAGSKILKGYAPEFDAEVVTRLYNAGVIILGKTNMDEFGMGSTTESSAFKPTTSNPWDDTRVPGGSSGGSAAAVSGQLCAASLGSDTGGSIRQPAAFCGIVGLKPSYGRVSRHGLLAYASSFDCIGPLTSSVEDAAILMDAMCGNNNKSLDSRHHSAALSKKSDKKFLDAIVSKKNLDREPLKGKSFAIIKETFFGLDEKISSSVLETIELVESLGARVHEVSCPTFLFGLPAYYILALSEASSNLARYDGIRFGAQNYLSFDLEKSIKSSRFEGFGAEVKRRILMGTYTLSEGYSDAYYKRAQDVRRLIYAEMTAHLQNYDGLLTPATSALAYKKNENQEPLAMFTGDLMTVNVNLSGLPALVIRSRDTILTEEGNKVLPSGIQIIGKKYGEADLLGVGHVIEMFSLERKLYKDTFPDSFIFD